MVTREGAKELVGDGAHQFGPGGATIPKRFCMLRTRFDLEKGARDRLAPTVSESRHRKKTLDTLGHMSLGQA